MGNLGLSLLAGHTMAHTYQHLSLEVLLTAVVDCYVPSSAKALLEGLRGLDDESSAVTMELWAMDAELEICVN